MFGGDGVIAKRLAVEAAPLPAGKTSVRLFDMEGLACDGVSRVLLNDVLACRDDSGEREGCLAAIATSSRTDAEFVRLRAFTLRSVRVRNLVHTCIAR